MPAPGKQPPKRARQTPDRLQQGAQQATEALKDNAGRHAKFYFSKCSTWHGLNWEGCLQRAQAMAIDAERQSAKTNWSFVFYTILNRRVKDKSPIDFGILSLSLNGKGRLS